MQYPTLKPRYVHKKSKIKRATGMKTIKLCKKHDKNMLDDEEGDTLKKS